MIEFYFSKVAGSLKECSFSGKFVPFSEELCQERRDTPSNQALEGVKLTRIYSV